MDDFHRLGTHAESLRLTTEGAPSDGFFVVERLRLRFQPMPDGVREAFVDIAQQRGRMPRECAEAWLLLTAALIFQFTSVTHTTVGR